MIVIYHHVYSSYYDCWSILASLTFNTLDSLPFHQVVCNYVNRGHNLLVGQMVVAYMDHHQMPMKNLYIHQIVVA